VAVQRGSIYEDQVQKTLVQSGLIPPTNLLLYDDIAAAIRDLDEERVDVFVLDLPVAEKYVAAGAARLAGQRRQRRSATASPCARAPPHCATSSTPRWPQCRPTGTTARLAEQYLGIPAAELAPVTEAAVAEVHRG
jgi:tripartite-type tricarboxylate transporter receptor subunit TctC